MIFWLAAAASAGTLADQVALHLRLDGRAVDPQTLGTGYAALCDAGDDLACKWRAWDRFGRVQREDLVRLTDPVCTAGRAEACLLLAWGLGLTDAHTFDAGAVDPSRAVGLLDQACEAGVARACTELGLVLTEDKLSDPEPDRAVALHRKACAAGLDIGCLRLEDKDAALALGTLYLLPSAEACEAGIETACEASLASAKGTERIPILERLCHIDGEHCGALAEARRDDRGADTLPEGAPAVAVFAGSDLLLGWHAESFQDHVLVDLESIDRALIRVLASRHEQVVLVGPGERELVLPGEEDCDEVVRMAAGLEAAGVLPRVVDDRGGPAMSICIDALGPGKGPVYQGGRIALDPVDPSDVGLATQLKGVLVDNAGGLFTCGDAASSDRTLDPFRIAVVHKRSDRFAKLKPLTTSGADSFDKCVLDWAASVPVPPAVVAARYELEVLLVW